MKRFLSQHGETIILVMLVIFACSSSVAWIVLDTRPQPGADPNSYLIKTFEIVDSLKAQGREGLWRSISEASIQGRPPLYQAFTVPFIFIIGRSEDAALTVNIILLAILILATYGIGYLAWSKQAGLLSAYLVATYPPIIHLYTIYRSHVALPSSVALSMCLLLLMLKTRSAKVAWLFGVSLGLGMLLHPNFLYLMPIPALIFGLYMIHFQVPPQRPPRLIATPNWLLRKFRDPFVLFGLLPASLIAIGLAAIWYLPRIQEILDLQQAVTLYWSDQTYGFNTLPHSFWWYALTMPGTISYVLAALLVMGLIACAALRRIGPHVLLITFVAMYIGLSLRQGDYAWLHFTAVLPVAAAITAIGVLTINDIILAGGLILSKLVQRRVALSKGVASAGMISGGTTEGQIQRTHVLNKGGKVRLLSTVVTLVCVGVAAFNFYYVAWGLGPWSQPIAKALGAVLYATDCPQRMILAFCPNPPEQENWRLNDILRVVLSEPECKQRGCNLVIVPKLQDTFNSILFEYTLLRDFPRSRKNIHISGADGWGGALGDAQWVLSDFLVYIPHWRGEDAPREIKIGTAVTQFLESSPPVFDNLHQEIASFSLPDGLTAKLVKRIKPVTMETSIQSYEEALSHVANDVMLYEKLGFLYLRMDNWSRAEDLFRRAAQIDPQPGWPYRSLAYVYQEQGLKNQAVEAFRRAIEIEPYDSRAYQSLGGLFEKSGDFQKAIDVYKLAIQRNPRFVWPYTELGSLYVYTNQIDDAKAIFQVASRLEPWNQIIQNNLMNLYWTPASNLSSAEAFSGSTKLEWWRGESWVRPYPANPDVLVGSSNLTVGGKSWSDQIHMSPYSGEETTTLQFVVRDSHFEVLETGFGLADQVIGLSNGVRYTIRLSFDEGKSYITILDKIVSDAIWKVQTIPLIAYWGEDLTFELTVDALGGESFDWLQTTVRFFPPHKVWDLASNLVSIQASSGQIPLSWNSPSAWVDDQGRQLVTFSQLPVQGRARDNQVQYHPQSDDQETTITFSITDNPYTTLTTAFALADEAVGLSDGVRYTIAISTDGKTYTTLLEEDVSHNAWKTVSIDLNASLHQNLKIRLVSNSMGNDDYDWLQITLDLLAPDD